MSFYSKCKTYAQAVALHGHYAKNGVLTDKENAKELLRCAKTLEEAREGFRTIFTPLTKIMEKMAVEGVEGEDKVGVIKEYIERSRRYRFVVKNRKEKNIWVDKAMTDRQAALRLLGERENYLLLTKNDVKKIADSKVLSQSLTQTTALSSLFDTLTQCDSIDNSPTLNHHRATSIFSEPLLDEELTLTPLEPLPTAYPPNFSLCRDVEANEDYSIYPVWMFPEKVYVSYLEMMAWVWTGGGEEWRPEVDLVNWIDARGKPCVEVVRAAAVLGYVKKHKRLCSAVVDVVKKIDDLKQNPTMVCMLAVLEGMLDRPEDLSQTLDLIVMITPQNTSADSRYLLHAAESAARSKINHEKFAELVLARSLLLYNIRQLSRFAFAMSVLNPHGAPDVVVHALKVIHITGKGKKNVLIPRTAVTLLKAMHGVEGEQAVTICGYLHDCIKNHLDGWKKAMSVRDAVDLMAHIVATGGKLQPSVVFDSLIDYVIHAERCAVSVEDLIVLSVTLSKARLPFKLHVIQELIAKNYNPTRKQSTYLSSTLARSGVGVNPALLLRNTSQREILWDLKPRFDTRHYRENTDWVGTGKI